MACHSMVQRGKSHQKSSIVNFKKIPQKQLLYPPSTAIKELHWSEALSLWDFLVKLRFHVKDQCLHRAHMTPKSSDMHAQWKRVIGKLQASPVLMTTSTPCYAASASVAKMSCWRFYLCNKPMGCLYMNINDLSSKGEIWNFKLVSCCWHWEKNVFFQYALVSFPLFSQSLSNDW